MFKALETRRGVEAAIADVVPVTRADKLAELRRELAFRERLFPQWVAKGTKRKADADRQIKVLKAVISDYEKESP